VTKAIRRKSAEPTGPRRDRKSRRNVLVLAGLLLSLTLTSMLLLLLAPSPLVPDAAKSLIATESANTLDPIFDTRVAVNRSRWKYIYIHHSKTRHGNAVTIAPSPAGMGDHFLIGNGDGCGDGEIQVGRRWVDQQTARPAAASVADNCISICVVGDLDQNPLTKLQMRRLQQLVQTLQTRCDIPRNGILMYDQPDSSAGVGNFFPIDEFARQMLP
jgi:hypothetical protein